MTPQEAAEESKKGFETMHRIHAIADFKKHFEKFRSEPFKSSLLYWIMTGTISGNFAITIDEFTKEMQMDGARAIDTANNIINKDKDQALSSALKEIAELHAKLHEMSEYITKVQSKNDDLEFANSELHAKVKELESKPNNFM